MAIPFNLTNRDAMIKAAQTSLSSKVNFIRLLVGTVIKPVFEMQISHSGCSFRVFYVWKGQIGLVRRISILNNRGI